MKMNEELLHQVKIWVLDHACKHDMESVLKLIVKDVKIEELFKSADCGSEKLDINCTFLFLLLLKNLIKSLKTAQQDAANKYSTWQKSLLPLVIKLLMSTYAEDHYISIKHFLNLIMKLKRMEITRCLLEDPSAVIQRLNAVIPRMTEPYKIELREQYGLDEDLLGKLQSSNTIFRRFILKLSINSTLRQEYTSRCLANDMLKYINNVLVILTKILSTLQNKAGLSIIEKIVAESSSDQGISNNDAVQLILEYVQDANSESDLLTLLQSFDSDQRLDMEDGLADIMSELGSDGDLDFGSTSLNEEEDVSAAKKKRTSEKNADMFDDPLAGTSLGFVPMDDEMEIISDSEEGNAS